MNSKWTSESIDCSYYKDGINLMIEWFSFFLLHVFCFMTHYLLIF